MVRINEDRPVALYNTDKKQLIGIFQTQTLAARYAIPHTVNNRRQVLHSAVVRSARLTYSVFPFPVAARFANELQLKMLDGADLYICDEYPQAESNVTARFYSNANSLRLESNERTGRYRAEQRRQNQPQII